MKGPACLWFVVTVATAITAQAQAPIEVDPVGKYCSRVESFSSSHQPRIFAQTDKSQWAEFANPKEWKRAGSPTPLALAWQRGGEVVRVAVASEKGADDRQQPYSDYCYRADGSLAVLRSMPEKVVDCDASHFRCRVTLRGAEQAYPKDSRLAKNNERPGIGGLRGQAVGVDQMLDEVASVPFQSEQTSIALDLKVPPQYLHVSDLPFYGLLFGPGQ